MRSWWCGLGLSPPRIQRWLTRGSRAGGGDDGSAAWAARRCWLIVARVAKTGGAAERASATAAKDGVQWQHEGHALLRHISLMAVAARSSSVTSNGSEVVRRTVPSVAAVDAGGSDSAKAKRREEAGRTVHLVVPEI